MAFTNEDRERMIRTEEAVGTMHDAMFTEDGLSRCAVHSAKIENVEKAVDSNQKWTKGLVASFLGSIFVAIIAFFSKP